MKSTKYIAFDCESGGTEKASLLTVYFAVLDQKFNVIDELYLYVCPNDRKYVVTGEALGINRINLTEHDQKARTYSDAGQTLFNFLKTQTDNGKEKLIPVGHNIYFDIEAVTEHLLSKGTWSQFVSYRILDTGVVAQLFRAIGLLPNHVNGSLESLLTHYEMVSVTDVMPIYSKNLCCRDGRFIYIRPESVLNFTRK